MDQPDDTDTGFLSSYAQLIMNKFKKKSDETFDIYLCAEDQRFILIYIKLFKRKTVFKHFILSDLDQLFNYSV